MPQAPNPADIARLTANSGPPLNGHLRTDLSIVNRSLRAEPSLAQQLALEGERNILQQNIQATANATSQLDVVVATARVAEAAIRDLSTFRQGLVEITRDELRRSNLIVNDTGSNRAAVAQARNDVLSTPNGGGINPTTREALERLVRLEAAASRSETIAGNHQNNLERHAAEMGIANPEDTVRAAIRQRQPVRPRTSALGTSGSDVAMNTAPEQELAAPVSAVPSTANMQRLTSQIEQAGEGYRNAMAAMAEPDNQAAAKEKEAPQRMRREDGVGGHN